MSTTDEFITAARDYAATFDQQDLPMPPSRQVAVVACMDARLNVYGLLGLREGEAHVIRNAGGVVSEDVIRSLTISQRLLGTREIMLIHHTDCGMLTFTDDDFKATVESDTGCPHLGGRSVRRCRGGHAPVDAEDQSQSISPAQERARLRLRRQQRRADRGRLETPRHVGHVHAS